MGKILLVILTINGTVTLQGQTFNRMSDCRQLAAEIRADMTTLGWRNLVLGGGTTYQELEGTKVLVRCVRKGGVKS